MKPFKVGIDSYSLKPLRLSAFELLDWVIMNEAEGAQFSEVNLGPGQELDKGFLKELAAYASENGLYLEWGGGEHIPLDLATKKPKDVFASNKKAAEQARALGVNSIRSCSGGLMRWKKEPPSTEELLALTAKSLRSQRSMLMDLGVILAIETHFEFTTFELLRLFDMCDARPGEYLGICLDTMNLLTMLEDPVSAVRRALPWVVTTHIKDGGILITDDGFVTFPVEAGRGIVDFEEILGLFSSTPRPLNLSLEDHGGDFLLPVYDPGFLAGFPDLKAPELVRLIKLSTRTQELLDEGKIAVLDRAHWPEHCERRVKRGLRAIQGMVKGKLR
ncbi:MAG TPA: TIM barrel protein [Candidatus Aminicenantes bacterium]|nr:TIM barrel protein [Acidobacteriota bacterium]HOI44335.1 TIM barrel protein [Candidatus Aminicenantes bacterium]